MATNYLTMSRQALYDLVWAQPLKQVAEGLGISEEILKKRCFEINVPTPPLEYWTRIKAGNTPQRAPLPKHRTMSEARVDRPAQATGRALAPSQPSNEPQDRSLGQRADRQVLTRNGREARAVRRRRVEAISDVTLHHLRNVIEEPLKQEIGQLRYNILKLARDQELVYEALERQMGESEPWAWQRQAVKVIVEHVTRGPLVQVPPPRFYRHMAGVTAIGHARVPCPLCGAGREAFTNQDDEADSIGTFSVPIGLQRHLEGYGRVRQCVVMAAAGDLAREAWERKQKAPAPLSGPRRVSE
jgi:hypothetical protein